MKSIRLTYAKRRQLAEAICTAYAADEKAAANAALAARDKYALASIEVPIDANNVHLWLERGIEGNIGFSINLASDRRIYSQSRIVENDPVLVGLALAAITAERVYHTKRQDIFNQVLELLATCSTTRILVEVWPDAAQFVDTLLVNEVGQQQAAEAAKRKRLAIQIAKKFEEAGFDTILDTSADGEAE